MNKIEEIDLNVTNRCNIGCSHCLFSAGPERGDDLPLNLIKKVLSDGRRLGAKEVHITGGEPLVRKDVLEILKITHTLGYFVRLQTNLWAFQQEMIPQFKKYTREILTSIDGLEKSHDSIRRKDSFRRTISWIKNCFKKTSGLLLSPPSKKRIVTIS